MEKKAKPRRGNLQGDWLSTDITKQHISESLGQRFPKAAVSWGLLEPQSLYCLWLDVVEHVRQIGSKLLKLCLFELHF
jgi:hypothetical protein